ncbi:hypothetical protein Tco_0292024 [Tanacetum coccineum]
MAIKESKDLTSLSLDELIGNLKVYEVIIKKDSKIVKGKREQSRSLALKAKKESSNEKSSTSDSEDEEYAMGMWRSESPHGEFPKPLRNKNQRGFVGGYWSDSDEDEEVTTKDKTCLVAQASNENYMSNLVDDVLLRKCLYIRDYGRLRNMYLSFHHEFISIYGS